MLFRKIIFGWYRTGGGFAENNPSKRLFTKKGFIEEKGRDFKKNSDKNFVKEVLSYYNVNQKALKKEFNDNLTFIKTNNMKDYRRIGGGDSFFVLNGKKLQTNFQGLNLDAINEFSKGFNEICKKYF